MDFDEYWGGTINIRGCGLQDLKSIRTLSTMIMNHFEHTIMLYKFKIIISIGVIIWWWTTNMPIKKLLWVVQWTHELH